MYSNDDIVIEDAWYFFIHNNVVEETFPDFWQVLGTTRKAKDIDDDDYQCFRFLPEYAEKKGWKWIGFPLIEGSDREMFILLKIKA